MNYHVKLVPTTLVLKQKTMWGESENTKVIVLCSRTGKGTRNFVLELRLPGRFVSFLVDRSVTLSYGMF